MIIWGSKAKQTVVKAGVFYCPNCRLDTSYQQIRVSRYFTLYFIPLFPTATLGEAVVCGRCRGEFHANILSVPKEKLLDALATWVCRNCNNHNPPAEGSCLACGASRPAAGPPPMPPPVGA